MVYDPLPFKISTGLKSIIGRDLITDDYVAVFELVKNAFDAHAKKVTITFQTNRIIIEDDGKGMDLDDIKDKWLFVAYSAKKEGVEDSDLQDEAFDCYRNKIRPIKYFAGAKGIGRFSCDRLGSKLLERWYREQIRKNAPRLIAKWERMMGVNVSDLYVQRMKTKWGSCSAPARTIRLNSELAKKPRECLEYIVVHEMVHLLERTHNRRFMTLMEQFMPRWRSHRELLNRLPVRREKWVY